MGEKKKMKKTGVQDVSSLLNKAGMPFVLIGGYAGAAWGSVRATKDIDFLARIPSKQIGSLLDEFIKEGINTSYRKPDISDTVKGVIALEKDETIDILLGIQNMPEKLFENASSISFQGANIPIISPEDLIILKLLAGSPLDLVDAHNIFNPIQEKLNIEYLKIELNKRNLKFKQLEEKT